MRNVTIRNHSSIIVLAALAAGAFTVSPEIALGQELDTALEEIVVMARRREESLQSVPISISAFSGEDLEIRSIDNAIDMQVLLPNVDIRGGSGGRLSMGTANINIRGNEAVRYLDGVVIGVAGKYGGLGGLIRNVAELERVEVLKGPQGTLFGKNALGGAIQYISRKPANEFGARVRLTSSDARRDVAVNMDIPLTDTVKTKLTVVSEERDGYVTSVVTGEKYGQTSGLTIRGVVSFQPTENFSAELAVQTDRVDGNGQAQVAFGVNEGFGPMNLYNGPLGLELTNDRLNYGDREQYLNVLEAPGILMLDSTIASLHLTWALSDSISLKSITSIRSLEHGQTIDVDTTGLYIGDRWQYHELEERSQEFQLIGGNGRFDWIAGLYYGESELKRKNLDWDDWEMMSINPGVVANFRNELIGQEPSDKALYGEFNYDITDKLRLTLGARYAEEEYTATEYDPAEPLPAPGVAIFSVNGSVIPGSRNTGSYSHTTGRFVLQYQFADDKMAYVNVSSGFNGGGYNSVEDGSTPYEPESLVNYEIGLRSDWLDKRLRLNISAFTTRHEDIQIARLIWPDITDPSTRMFPTFNGGTAQVDGFELDTVIRLSNTFTLNASVGTLDGKYTDIDGTAFGAWFTTDTKLPYLPELSYSIGLQHDARLESGGSFTSRIDWGWTDDVEDVAEEQFQSPTWVGGFQYDDNSYGLLSGRIAYTSAQGNWTLAAYGKNILDEYYQVSVFSVPPTIDPGVPGRPRELGVRFSVDF